MAVTDNENILRVLSVYYLHVHVSQQVLPTCILGFKLKMVLKALYAHTINNVLS